MTFNKQELATIVAALRLSQWHLQVGSLEAMLQQPGCQAHCDMIDEIAAWDGIVPLSTDDIEDLCERLEEQADISGRTSRSEPGIIHARLNEVHPREE